MSWEPTLITTILYLTALFSICMACFAFNKRGGLSTIVLGLFLCAAAEWAISLGMMIVVESFSWKIIFVKSGYAGEVILPTLLLVFTLAYTQQDRFKTRTIGLLLIVPVIAIILIITNDVHHWIWSSFLHRPSIPYLAFSGYGNGYYILVFYNTLILFTSIILLVKAWLKEIPFNRIRIAIILFAILIPMIASGFHHAGLDPISGLDITPIFFLCTGVLVAFGIFRIQIFNIIPIARESLIENMRDGVFVIDLNDHLVEINLAGQEAIGVSAKDFLGKPVGHLPGNWVQALEQIDGDRIRHKEILFSDDPPRYLELQVTRILDHRQRPLGKLVVFRDVTERHKAELELALRTDELSLLNKINLAITSGLDLDLVLRTLYEQCHAVIPFDVFYVALYDDATGIINIPLYYEDEYKYLPTRDLHNNPGVTGYVIKTRTTLYLPNLGTPGLPPGITPVAIGGTPSRSYIGIPLLLRDKVIGVMSIQSYAENAYNDKQIRLLEAVAVEAAIAIENAKLYGEVQRLAIIDELTGIYNFRGLLELGQREVERAQRFNHPLSLLFFDIDGFRSFNNTYSHATGNLVLKAVSENSKEILRSVDILARYGGDEFVIILPETSRVLARRVALRLIKKISTTLVPTEYGRLSITISAGLATLTTGINDIHALMDQANRAEHRAKLVGNCLEIEM